MPGAKINLTNATPEVTTRAELEALGTGSLIIYDIANKTAHRIEAHSLLAIFENELEHGDDGNHGWTPQLSVVSDGDRRVLQLTAWTGGGGTEPAGVGQYLGSGALVSDIANAVDIRGAAGTHGDDGWTPVFALVPNGDNEVLQVIDWTGGAGIKPTTGQYVGAGGLVTAIGSAVNLKGQDGAGSEDGWTPVFAVVSNGEHRVLQVSDWTGGEGVKPTTGQYVGATGFVTAVGSAVDIRGAAGNHGNHGTNAPISGFLYRSLPHSAAAPAAPTGSATYTPSGLFSFFAGVTSDWSSQPPDINPATHVVYASGYNFTPPATAVVFSTPVQWTGGAGTQGSPGVYLLSLYRKTNLGANAPARPSFTSLSAAGAVVSYVGLTAGWSGNPPAYNHDTEELWEQRVYILDATTGVLSGNPVRWTGPQGTEGDDGWTPVFAIRSDGDRQVLQVNDWTGGEGTKPFTGSYLGAGGFVANIADAVDIAGRHGTDAPLNPAGPSAVGIQVVGTSSALGASALWQATGVAIPDDDVFWVNFGSSGSRLDGDWKTVRRADLLALTAQTAGSAYSTAPARSMAFVDDISTGVDAYIAHDGNGNFLVGLAAGANPFRVARLFAGSGGSSFSQEHTYTTSSSDVISGATPERETAAVELDEDVIKEIRRTGAGIKLTFSGDIVRQGGGINAGIPGTFTVKGEAKEDGALVFSTVGEVETVELAAADSKASFSIERRIGELELDDLIGTGTEAKIVVRRTAGTVITYLENMQIVMSLDLEGIGGSSGPVEVQIDDNFQVEELGSEVVDVINQFGFVDTQIDIPPTAKLIAIHLGRGGSTSFEAADWHLIDGDKLRALPTTGTTATGTTAIILSDSAHAGNDVYIGRTASGKFRVSTDNASIGLDPFTVGLPKSGITITANQDIHTAIPITATASEEYELVHEQSVPLTGSGALNMAPTTLNISEIENDEVVYLNFGDVVNAATYDLFFRDLHLLRVADLLALPRITGSGQIVAIANPTTGTGVNSLSFGSVSADATNNFYYTMGVHTDGTIYVGCSATSRAVNPIRIYRKNINVEVSGNAVSAPIGMEVIDASGAIAASSNWRAAGVAIPDDGVFLVNFGISSSRLDGDWKTVRRADLLALTAQTAGSAYSTSSALALTFADDVGAGLDMYLGHDGSGNFLLGASLNLSSFRVARLTGGAVASSTGGSAGENTAYEKLAHPLTITTPDSINVPDGITFDGETVGGLEGTSWVRGYSFPSRKTARAVAIRQEDGSWTVGQWIVTFDAHSQFSQSGDLADATAWHIGYLTGDKWKRDISTENGYYYPPYPIDGGDPINERVLVGAFIATGDENGFELTDPQIMALSLDGLDFDDFFAVEYVITRHNSSSSTYGSASTQATATWLIPCNRLRVSPYTFNAYKNPDCSLLTVDFADRTQSHSLENRPAPSVQGAEEIWLKGRFLQAIGQTDAGSRVAAHFSIQELNAPWPAHVTFQIYLHSFGG